MKTWIIALFLAIASLAAQSPCPASATAAQKPSDDTKESFQLAISMDLAANRLTGTARITIAAHQALQLGLHGLSITGSLLRDQTGHENALTGLGDVLILPAAPVGRTLFLSYTVAFPGQTDNCISKDFIVLNENWHPVPTRPMQFSLSAALPAHLTAITEADQFPLTRKDGLVNASFSHKVQNIHLIAAPYVLTHREVREGLSVFAAFFPEDRDLAADYLARAASFIQRYEKEIGPYPYHHFVIAANRFPTGYSMPAMTQLGQMVLRLPFIKTTSLGHEIVHSWFGNSVEVRPDSGNWCEGLASFLADHAYRQDAGEGLADRKESILKYLSYVHDDTAISLSQFHSASHTLSQADARRAVGYERGAMFFSELRTLIGKDAFANGVKLFYRQNAGIDAGWLELQHAFEAVSGQKLDTFFTERLNRKDIPALAVEDAEITITGNAYRLSLTILQNTTLPYALFVPIRVETMNGTHLFEEKIREKKELLTITLPERPLAVTIDPEYTFLRQLDPAEISPVWSMFMGSANRLAIVEEARLPLYQPILDRLNIPREQIVFAGKAQNSELAKHDLLFLGGGQTPARSIFGAPRPGLQFSLKVRKNPLASGHVAVLLTSQNSETSRSMAQRLPHYGKYSDLAVQSDEAMTKTTQTAENGIRVIFAELPQGGPTSRLDSFSQVMAQLKDTRVVYVGEIHDAVADHRLQLQIIEALYGQNPNLAIGMEMFPSSTQEILDQYTTQGNDMSEQEFLKKSQYYSVWRYDYRFFRDIFQFARGNRIPVVGLNLDRRIVSAVFRTGNTDGLSAQDQKELPRDRDLTFEGYADELEMIHAQHAEEGLGSGTISGFIQAQGLWDETMAANISGYLRHHPATRMVVLAGTQHTRKDFGIPPRVGRQLPVTQATIINGANQNDGQNLALLADYYFLAEPAALPPTPIIGVVLEPGATPAGDSFLRIDRLVDHSKAKEAGLLPDDIIKEIDGLKIENMDDVRIAMLDKKAGEPLQLVVGRMGNGREEIVNATVILSGPAPHGGMILP